MPGASVQFCQEMFTYLWTHLMTALQKESEPAVIDSMVEAIRDIVDLMPEMLTDEQKQETFKVGCVRSVLVAVLGCEPARGLRCGTGLRTAGDLCSWMSACCRRWRS